MTPTDTLRLDNLFLSNFRCFARCEVQLHPQLTVLVAENGRGKTAILDAIGIALGLFVDTVSNVKQYTGFSSRDIRMVPEHGTMIPILPTEFIAGGTVAGQQILWSRALKGDSTRHRTSTRGADKLLQAALQLRADVERCEEEKSQPQPILPLVAFYGAGRVWNEQLPTASEKRKRDELSRGRMAGYFGCLSSSSSVKDVVAWYENTANKTRDPRFSTELAQNLSLLTAVREATRVVLEPTGWSQLDWDFDLRQLVVEHPSQGRLPLGALSDGIRNSVALVADISRRCASLNPHLGEEAARQTPGILLVDEVDAHLHPGWQQQVVDLLRQAFPTIQMVLSTHSPHVLSTVDMKSIVMIRLHDGEGLLETPRFQTRGVESADVLAEIMDVDPIPHVEPAQWLSNYRALIQQHSFDTVEGRNLRALLEAHFGNQHPVMLDCDRMIRLERFKQTLVPTTEQG